MKRTRIALLATLVGLGSCGRQVELKPASGQSLPVKPLMATSTPTPKELLEIPTYAKPDRIDELVKRSEPRPQDPFNLPPPTGGRAPSLPPGSESLPATNEATPTPPGD